jgi:hypothetical protein
MGELPGVAQYHCTDGEGVLLKSVKHRYDKNGCFSHTRFGLAKQVVTQEGVGDALLLDFRGMFKSRVGNGSVKFWEEEEVFESCGMDA